MNMKLNPNLTQPQIFKNYKHPWYEHIDNLNKPNPPSQESVDKAKFVDKTYRWRRDNRI